MVRLAVLYRGRVSSAFANVNGGFRVRGAGRPSALEAGFRRIRPSKIPRAAFGTVIFPHYRPTCYHILDKYHDAARLEPAMTPTIAIIGNISSKAMTPYKVDSTTVRYAKADTINLRPTL